MPECTPRVIEWIKPGAPLTFNDEKMVRLGCSVHGTIVDLPIDPKSAYAVRDWCAHQWDEHVKDVGSLVAPTAKAEHMRRLGGLNNGSTPIKEPAKPKKLWARKFA